MPETTVTYVVQRLRLKRNGEPYAEGWRDEFTSRKLEQEAQKVLEHIRETERRWTLGGEPPRFAYRLVKIEERREVIA